jgi:hypothetical protein
MNDAPIDIGVQNNFGNRVRPIVGKALPVTGLSAFVDHKWTGQWSSAVGYSRGRHRQHRWTGAQLLQGGAHTRSPTC